LATGVPRAETRAATPEDALSAEYDVRLLRNFSRPADVAGGRPPEIICQSSGEVLTFAAEHRTDAARAEMT
jgi:hypothetical protein